MNTTQTKATALQWAVLGFMYAFRADEDRLPTRAEISGHFGWRSVNAAETHINFLIAKGFVEKRGIHLRFARTEKGRKALAALAASPLAETERA